MAKDYEDLPSKESPRKQILKNYGCCSAKGGASCTRGKSLLHRMKGRKSKEKK